MRISILGSGGVGGYFGGRLAKAGFDVRFLARGTHLKVMQAKGLTVKSVNGDFHIPHPFVTDSMEELGQSDLVILAVKAWQVKELAAEMGAILHKDTVVLPLQNGVLASEEVAEVIGQEKVLKGLCRIFSLVEAPGVIRHGGVDPTILFGEWNHSRTTRVERLADIFTRSGITNHIPQNIDVERWHKFISICLGGLLAVSHSTYGECRSVPETRTLMWEMLREGYSLARAMSIPVDPEYPERAMAFIDTFKPEATASLTRDIWQGKPSELEYQNGTMVKLAEEFGVSVPVNRFIYYCLLPGEIRARQGKK